MRPVSLPFAVTLLALAALPAALDARPTPADAGPRSGRWAHETASLQPDARVIWGRLDNGVRYALLPHAGVPGRVSMRMIMLSGSVDERANERGIAHFTEHMVFRGTKRFRYEEMVGFFQKLGMEYGSDVNAVTSLDYTGYMLDFRSNETALLHQGLMLLRDFADSATFDAGYIERERGVILSELRMRAGVMGEHHASLHPLIYRGHRVAERLPGGEAEQIRRFTREQFLEFYRRCYRPDLAVVVAVGDFDPAGLVGLIREEFGAIPARSDPVPARDEGRLDTRKALRASIFPITDIGSMAVTIASVSRPTPRPDSLERHIEAQRRRFAFSLFSERLNQTLPGNGEADFSTLMGIETAQARLITGPGEWEPAVTGLDEVLRATLERGFTAREIDQLRRHNSMLAAFMLEQAATMDPAGLMDRLVESIVDHTVYLGFEEEWRIYIDWLARLTPQDLLQSFRGAWDLERMAFHIAGEIEEVKGGEATVLKRVAEVRKGRMRTLRMDTRDPSIFTLLKWGSPTPVVERGEVPDLGVRLYRFGNNVRLNFLPRRHEPGLVRAVVRVGDGVLGMPGNQPALKEFGLQTLLASGAGRYTSERVGEIVDDHMLGFSLDLEDHDAFTFRGLTRTEDFRAFLGVTTEFLHRPRFETHVHRSHKLLGAIQRALGGMGMGEGFRELEDHLFKGDPRFTWGTFNNYLGLSVLDVRNWLQPPLTSGYVEMTVVGDIGEDELLDLVSRTLGSLPVRAATKARERAPEPVKVSAPAGYQRIEFVGEQHQAVVVGSWPVLDADTVRDSIALHIVGRVMDIRIREQVRDELGLAYSPRTTFDGYDGFPGFGMLQTMIDCAPADATRVAELVTAIGASAAGSGLTPGEFQGALGVYKGQIRRAFLDNGFLLKYISRAQEDPSSIDDLIAASRDLFDSITFEETDAWARKVLRPDNLRAAAIVPKPFIGIFQTGTP